MPYKQKIAVEEKVRIVRECLGHKISISEATRIAGVDFETVKLWINKYENEGVEGFIHKGQKVYTAEMKTAAVIEYLRGGGSLQGICRKYGIRSTRNTGYDQQFNSGTGLRCIMLMETSTP